MENLKDLNNVNAYPHSMKIEDCREVIEEPRIDKRTLLFDSLVTDFLIKNYKELEESLQEEKEFKKTKTINGKESDENKRNLETILKHFGPEVEVNKLIEELVELTHAVISFKKSQSSLGYDLRKIDVIGEIADVEITLAHFKKIYDVSDEEVEWIKKTKLKKLASDIRALELEKETCTLVDEIRLRKD